MSAPLELPAIAFDSDPRRDDVAGCRRATAHRFLKQPGRLVGTPPSRYRTSRTSADMRAAIGTCALGFILVAASDRGVCSILLDDDPFALMRALQERFPGTQPTGADPAFERLLARVVAFVESPARGLDLPLDVRGTAFQQRVWDALRAIPVGQTLSYAQLAQRVGAPKAVRAVANACAANPLAVAIPCHRALRRDGAISGYRWGVARKRALLAREARERER